MKNVPSVVMGVVAVSRDCFPAELSRKRRVKVVEECKARNIPVVELQTVVENENDVVKALSEIRDKRVDALVLYLGQLRARRPDDNAGTEIRWSCYACCGSGRNWKGLV